MDRQRRLIGKHQPLQSPCLDPAAPTFQRRWPHEPRGRALLDLPVGSRTTLATASQAHSRTSSRPPNEAGVSTDQCWQALSVHLLWYSLNVDPAQLESLDLPSRRFAERLFARFPHWLSFGAVESSGANSTLRVDVPSPTGDTERIVRVWMEGGVPSLGFGEWHTHADLFSDEDGFLSFLDSLVSDRQLFLVVSTWASRWSVVERPTDDEIADALTGERAPHQVRVVSWSGKKDRTVRLSDLK
jgi:hypothetical protein